VRYNLVSGAYITEDKMSYELQKAVRITETEQRQNQYGIIHNKQCRLQKQVIRRVMTNLARYIYGGAYHIAL